MTPIGRFAPSPTGQLHLGSLTTAVASFCHIKSLQGKWLVRIEDVDFERCKASFAVSILQDLENLGLYADDEVLYQSKRTAVYDEFLHDKLSRDCYVCTCSRKTLSAYFKDNPPTPHPFHKQTQLAITTSLETTPIYPRFCLSKQLSPCPDGKLRLILPDALTAFYDGILGVVWDNPAQSLGDVVVKRQNGMINYILACSIDDGLQGITHVMRGVDILPMTAAQLDIIKMCGLGVPNYFYHLPLLHNSDGQKLSKQNLATPIDTSTPFKVRQLLVQALTLLGQNLPPDLLDGKPHEILAWGVKHWDNQPLQSKVSLGTA